MKAITKPKIQELQSREDLELLVNGDVVLMNRNGGRPINALYLGENSSKNFIFIVREDKHRIKRVVVDREYAQLSKEGFLIVKPIVEFTNWKNDGGAYDLLNEKLIKAGI